MLRKVAFAGCILAGASCAFADGPRGDLGSLELLFDNGPVSYEGVRMDGDKISPAALLYDNGDDNYSNGNEMTLWMEANDFVLKGQSNVQHIDFSVLNTQSGNNNANFDGNVAWSIFADAGGAPGSLIASGVGNNVVVEFDRFSTWDFWDFSFDLDSAQCLDAGTYWLGLNLNTGCDSRDELYWGTTNGGNGTAHAEAINCTTLGVNALEHSFSVSGTVGCGDCLAMKVSTLGSGKDATWAVSGATPNTEVAIVWGTAPGSTSVNGFARYCADFGIKGVKATRVVCRKTADGAGNLSCNKTLPGGIAGMRILTQAAERDTCPDSCVSGVDDQIVQ